MTTAVQANPSNKIELAHFPVTRKTDLMSKYYFSIGNEDSTAMIIAKFVANIFLTLASPIVHSVNANRHYDSNMNNLHLLLNACNIKQLNHPETKVTKKELKQAKALAHQLGIQDRAEAYLDIATIQIKQGDTRKAYDTIDQGFPEPTDYLSGYSAETIDKLKASITEVYALQIANETRTEKWISDQQKIHQFSL